MRSIAAMSPLAAPIVAPRQQVQSRDWTGLGLQWRDRMVVVQGPEEGRCRTELAARPARPVLKEFRTGDHE